MNRELLRELRCCDRCESKTDTFWRFLAIVGFGAWVLLAIGGYYAIFRLLVQAMNTF